MSSNHEITISVVNGAIVLSNTAENAAPGDTITWSTTDTTYSFTVSFAQASWPFSDSFTDSNPISVSNGSNGGPHTVHTVAAAEQDPYTVTAFSDRRDDPPTTQGEIDVARP
ncbi:MAG: hypothetical protein HKN20_11185 [Gemmatimonadetes bacterium]|nr:hypothetical protein [Gemmatimonadota bacterium]